MTSGTPEKPAPDTAATGKPVPQTPQSDHPTTGQPEEIGGPKGAEPTRFGDWERNGRCSDF